MDPIVLLEQIREIVKRTIKNQGSEEEDEILFLAEKVRLLDEWMKKGGFSPWGNPLEKPLLDFCDCIEATGGVMETRSHKGCEIVVPIADEEWSDLGDSYLQACEALGRKPKMHEES